MSTDLDDKLYAEDAVTCEAIELKDGALKISIFPQRYRMVKISKEVPLYNADRLGPNLLATGDFESWPNGFQLVAPLTEQGEAELRAQLESVGGKRNPRTHFGPPVTAPASR